MFLTASLPRSRKRPPLWGPRPLERLPELDRPGPRHHGEGQPTFPYPGPGPFPAGPSGRERNASWGRGGGTRGNAETAANRGGAAVGVPGRKPDAQVRRPLRGERDPVFPVPKTFNPDFPFFKTPHSPFERRSRAFPSL